MVTSKSRRVKVGFHKQIRVPVLEGLFYLQCGLQLWYIIRREKRFRTTKEKGERMKGVFLQGGGAKGAFQAGALYGLHKRGVRFQIASGTSIGAINLYFMLTGNFEKLREVWTNVEVPKFDHDYANIDRVIDNGPIIEILRGLPDKGGEIKKAYVNHVLVKDCKILEQKKEIASIGKESRLEQIKYSSLLPNHGERKDSREKIIREFNSEKVFELFKRDVEKGIYEGYRLDGGIKNNLFMEPFLENRVDKLYLIVFKRDFSVPDEIEKAYGERLSVICPPKDFKEGDTLRFERDFCRGWFSLGEDVARRMGL